MLQYYIRLARGHFLNVRHWASWKQNQQNPHPPVCVVGVGEGVGSDPYLSHGLLVWITFRIVLHIYFNE